MPIETAQIIYVHGGTGAGKTFTGDYLAVAHGFKHVDGDYPLKNSHLPENRNVAAGHLICFAEGTKEGNKTKWAPYYEMIANMTVEAARTHDRVVLSHWTMYQPPRDLVVETFLAAGIKRDQITVLQLTTSRDILLEGHYERAKRQEEQGGEKLEDVLRAWLGNSFDGKVTKEKYIECMRAILPSRDIVDPAAIEVDVSSRSVAHLDNVDAAIGMPRDSSLSYEEIIQKVLPLDKARDEESIANGGWAVMTEMGKDFREGKLKAKWEQENSADERKRCRSSIIS